MSLHTCVCAIAACDGCAWHACRFEGIHEFKCSGRAVSLTILDKEYYFETDSVSRPHPPTVLCGWAHVLRAHTIV